MMIMTMMIMVMIIVIASRDELMDLIEDLKQIPANHLKSFI